MMGLKVLGTIYFDHQFGLGSIEIHDIRAKRFLPIKLDACRLFGAQLRP
jgi:hypothetical protein